MSAYRCDEPFGSSPEERMDSREMTGTTTPARQRLQARRVGAVAFAVAALVVLAGCSQSLAVVDDSGADLYEGTAGGVTIRLELVRSGPFTLGRGSAGGRPLALAAMSPTSGPAAVAMATAGGAGSATATGALSFDAAGARLDLAALGGEATLTHAGLLATPAAGSLSGRFAGPDAAVSLELRQWAEAIAGHGSIAGQTAVIAATVTGGDRARGLALFADGSSVEIGLEALSGGGLRIEGLGPPRTLHRKGR